VELVAVAPILVVAALACVQALLLAMSMLYSQVALDRAATGASDEVASESIPQPWRGGLELERPEPETPDQPRQVRVRMAVPSVLPGMRDPLHVSAAAELEESR